MDYTNEKICFNCKIEERFAGTMRKNLISMLDELELQECLELDSCSELLNRDNTLLHTTSLIKFPCFYRGKNYNGHIPVMSSSPVIKNI